MEELASTPDAKAHNRYASCTRDLFIVVAGGRAAWHGLAPSLSACLVWYRQGQRRVARRRFQPAVAQGAGCTSRTCLLWPRGCPVDPLGLGRFARGDQAITRLDAAGTCETQMPQDRGKSIRAIRPQCRPPKPPRPAQPAGVGRRLWGRTVSYKTKRLRRSFSRTPL